MYLHNFYSPRTQILRQLQGPVLAFSHFQTQTNVNPNAVLQPCLNCDYNYTKIIIISVSAIINTTYYKMN